jgi:hypothetical protein
MPSTKVNASGNNLTVSHWEARGNNDANQIIPGATTTLCDRIEVLHLIYFIMLNETPSCKLLRKWK